MRSLSKILILIVVMNFGMAAWALSDDSDTSTRTSPSRIEAVTDRIFLQEARLVETMHGLTPLVETYIQRMKADPDLWSVPDKDRYFLGRLVLDEKAMNNKAFRDHNMNTEADFLCGAIALEAERHGLQAPLHSAVYRMIKAKELSWTWKPAARRELAGKTGH